MVDEPGAGVVPRAEVGRGRVDEDSFLGGAVVPPVQAVASTTSAPCSVVTAGQRLSGLVILLPADVKLELPRITPLLYRALHGLRIFGRGTFHPHDLTGTQRAHDARSYHPPARRVRLRLESIVVPHVAEGRVELPHEGLHVPHPVEAESEGIAELFLPSSALGYRIPFHVCGREEDEVGISPNGFKEGGAFLEDALLFHGLG
mmetsp:Transcript_27055/g.79954  ORF Transcript_27055/g.79954 Transcript_27055/m.79954 type:complete len:203 (-) Transcript_27055:1089-1697(-)